MIFISSRIAAQGCPTSGYPSFYQCSDIEQFVTDYPDCSRLPSTLLLPQWGVSSLDIYPELALLDSISGNLLCDECSIDALIGLENISYVGGNVKIDEPHGTLTNLQGLNNLSYVGGNFILTECSDLISTNGLDNLLYIGNNISLNDNNQLIEIIGFENIHHLPGQLYFNEQDAMIDLSGFDSLITVGSNIRIWDNAVLNSLDGLNNIELIGGDLDIDHNDSLLQLDALKNLNTIGQNLVISKNERLDNIEALSSIVNFNGQIIVYQNDLLTSLSGLENIEAGSINNLYLSNCSSLSLCAQPNICEYLTNSMGPSTINFNDNGCNNETEIITNCSTTGLRKISSKKHFTVYPNPITSEAILRCEIPQGIIHLEIYDNLGRLVKSIPEAEGNEIKINRAGLANGFYSLRILKEREVIGNLKIIIGS